MQLNPMRVLAAALLAPRYRAPSWAIQTARRLASGLVFPRGGISRLQAGELALTPFCNPSVQEVKGMLHRLSDEVSAAAHVAFQPACAANAFRQY
jgi:hypothetical protein